MELTTLSYELVRFLIDWSIKGTLILSVVGIVAWLFFRQKPAWKSVLWTVAFGVILAVPLMSLAGVEIKIPLTSLPQGALFIEDYFNPLQLHFTAASSEPLSDSKARLSAISSDSSSLDKESNTPTIIEKKRPWGIWLFAGIYVMGLIWGILRLGWGIWGISRLCKKARWVGDIGQGVLDSERTVAPEVNGLKAILVGSIILIVGGGIGALHPAYSEETDLLPTYPEQTVFIDGRKYEIVWMPQRVAAVHSKDKINASRQVAVITIMGKDQFKAGLWSVTQRNNVLDLGSLPGKGPWSGASVINDHGAVVGTFREEWNHLAHLFLWIKGEGMQLLPSLGGSQIAPADINYENQIVGWAGLPGDPAHHPFLWDEDWGITNLSNPPERHGQAMAINDSGVVVGSIDQLDGLRGSVPFIWTKEKGMETLEIPAEYHKHGGIAWDINNRGEVIVHLFGGKPMENKHQAFYMLGNPFTWTQGEGFVELPSLDGYEDIRTMEINERGDVLLRACNTPGSTGRCIEYLAIDREIVELPQLDGADHTQYSSINDKGWLIGSAVDFKSDSFENISGRTARGFAAIPVQTGN